MELNFFRILATLLNLSLTILIAYIVVKIVRHIINSFNRLERIENKLNEISESLKEKEH
ncbi:hypothetical protein [uncultured Clostridium sp.]|uniref:hypothetical protein n=1 Tax=uncultured Clostridium sp. TaxID=59620 RepID=UPI00259B7E6D|nr:hypothetical protein [uncultured Clostridium sp.]